MKQLLSIAAVFAVLAFGAFAYAQNEQQSGQPSKAELIKQFAHGGSGVADFAFDKDGHLEKVIVVGKASISTVIGPEGELIAEDLAELDCKARFVQWCKEKLTIEKGGSTEFIQKKSGSEAGSEAEAKLSTTLSKKIETKAEGVLRGMTTIYSGVIAEKKQFVIIKVFNRKLVNEIKQVRDELNSDNNDAVGNPNEYRQPAEQSSNGQLKDEHHVSPVLDKLW